MKKLFFPKLAWNNICKQPRLFVPNILSGAGVTAVFYIVLTLAMDEELGKVRGGEYVSMFMFLGVFVMLLVCSILIGYISRFLMKQRRSEYGLYAVLGLERRHIGRLLFLETGIGAVLSVFLGMVFGIAFYKLFLLLICRMLRIESVLGFNYIKCYSLLIVPVVMFGIYLMIFIFERIRLSRTNTVELLKSSNSGEKEPKIKWVSLVLGLLCMGGGYALSFTCVSPLMAIYTIFIAVILVILGTYFLYLSGIIAVLKLLKRTRNYYYKPRHMISVSGLLYRMKQNAVGLASICILSTMVLVMLSTTVSLYAGIEESLNRNFPYDLAFTASSTRVGQKDAHDYGADAQSLIVQAVRSEASEEGVEISTMITRSVLSFAAHPQDGVFCVNRNNYATIMDSTSVMLRFITAAEYERITGNTVELRDNEVLMQRTSKVSRVKTPDTLAFDVDGFDFKVVGTITDYPIRGNSDSVYDVFGYVVADDAQLQRIDAMQKEMYGENASTVDHEVMINFKDIDAVTPKMSGFVTNVLNKVDASMNAADDTYYVMSNAHAEAREVMYSMIGTLLSLGVLLTIVFMFATITIMYYKQLSEGYEDRERYQIMAKVGMSNQEIRKTINSQVIIVFFLPLLTAAVHVAAAFPILEKILKILFLPNRTLFITCTLISLTVFSVVYTVIYRMTSGVYFRIVRRHA